MTNDARDEASLRYHGEELVPADSLLRRLPAVLGAEERLRLDALAFAADALVHGWLTLKDVALHVGSETDRMNSRLRAAIFDAAWAIIDQLHNVRQLINGLVATTGDGPGPITARLLEKLRPASTLRNKMDHLSSNLRNMARRTGPQSALFGSLSYFLATDAPYQSGHSVVVQAGLLHGQQSWNVVNPAGRLFSPPVDFFELSAFDIRFELGPPIARFREWLNISVPDFEHQIVQQLREIASKGEHEFSKLMEHSGSGYTVILAMQFGENPEQVEQASEYRLPAAVSATENLKAPQP